ncbi:MAG: polysaccharide biosynthesis C-terminal domain-containing protein [Oscillospiraceae bacterium]|nr:polysaccharide biosynthesis C-terminal domain-containing protein [Oscillospiraceae bacterium]
MKNSRKLILNTVLLTMVAFLMQTVGVAFNVYLTNRIGAVGIGLFQLTMTVYGMAATFATAGVRLGSTRLSIDLLARDPAASAQKAMRLCLGYSLALSCVMGAVLYAGAPLAAQHWLRDIRTEPALRWLALCLPSVSLGVAAQGYFTAVRTIVKSAAVQVLEQAVKIAVVVVLLVRMLPRGVDYACLAIVYGMCAGEMAGMLLSFLFLWRDPLMRRRKKGRSLRLMELFHIAGPDAAGTCIRSVLLTTEHLLIPRGFQASGRSAEEAMRIYGVIHGMTLPVLLYPSAVLSSLSSLLVPEFSQLRVRGQEGRIDMAAKRILRLSLLYSVFAAGVFYAFAEPLSLRIYGNTDAARYLQVLAPLVPVMYVDMSVDGMLKGLDLQKYSMLYNIIDTGMCVALVPLLIPRLAVKGYMMILFASEIYNFAFSLRRLLMVTKTVKLKFTDIAKPVLCAAISALLPLGISNAMNPGFLGKSTLWLGLAICAGGGIYLAALMLSGSFTREDIKSLRKAV